VSPHILKLDVSGSPVEWIAWQEAATLYARDRVKWEAGETTFVVRGGQRRDGQQSILALNSIIAVADRGHRFDKRRAPPLTNRALFQRDGHLCLYCGTKHGPAGLTRDHVVPTSRGGRNVWTNVASACSKCNHHKRDRTPEQAGMRLLAVPYEPDPARYLLLVMSGRKITADQQAWLESCANPLQKAMQ
jgi:hypothetical protein